MAEYIAKAPALTVTTRSGYDAIQADGARIEFGEKRRILLKRPDRLRVEPERSDGDQGLLMFDGRGITVFKADDNVYARVEKPGTVDDILAYMVGEQHAYHGHGEMQIPDHIGEDIRATPLSHVRRAAAGILEILFVFCVNQPEIEAVVR